MRTGRVGTATDTGRRRLHNEDAYVCDPPLFAVADGMGGAQAGELASRLAAAALAERASGQQGEFAVAALVREANTRIFRRSVTDPAAAGMGTTMTVALLDEEGGTLAIAHVGDSRAYRLRDGHLEQLTADHSVVAELVRAGRLTEEEALQHPYRSAITRALGTEEDVDVDTITVAVAPGDLYLICSDGLTSMLRDDEILGIAASAGDPGSMAAALVDAANAAGGEDNVTVVIFEVEEGEPLARDEAPEAAAHQTEPGTDPEATTQVELEEREEDAPALTAIRSAEEMRALMTSARPTKEVRRWGAGAGSRWPALLLILVVLAVGALLVWWGVTQ